MGWLNCCNCQSREEKIAELDFSRCGLCDVPNDVYANSPTLEVLHLEGNKLKDLPPQLFQCIDLRYLNVSDNEIRLIPPFISKLTNLQVLIFSKNALHMEGIHNNLDKLTKLTILDLSMNDLGKVPHAILNLINLQQLCLNDTGIDYVPANIGRLANLRVLELRDNNLRGVPKSIRRLTYLQRLDISDNNISFFNALGEAHGNLTELWINGNNLIELQVAIGYLKKMNDFDGSYNNIQYLPKEIGYWTKITNLILSFNCLKDLPKAIGNLRNLQVLKLESNFIEELPCTISKLSNLEELNLQNNCLTKVPMGIGHLRKLATLILSDNKLKQLPPDVGSCCALTILNIHNNELQRLPDELGHLQKLTTLGLIGNQLSYLPITISKLSNLKALWLTPNQTQPLIHLQNEQLPDGQMVLTSVVFPQTPLKDEPIAPETPSNTHTTHITFNTERNTEFTDASLPLSRTPTPHHKELKRLREILRTTNLPDTQVPNISEIKEAKVTHITGELSMSQLSLNNGENEDIPREAAKSPPKQPPPYHIAAIYSKNAHLFAQASPPSPHDQPKQFSQQQPQNIHMPTPKLANNRHQLLMVQDTPVSYQQVDETGESPSQAKQVKWPFGHHPIYKVIEVELPETPRLQSDFQIGASSEGILVTSVNEQGVVHQKLFVDDKILAFDDVDYTVLEAGEAFEDASRKITTVKSVTVSRKQTV